jgi:hypothetical protein
MNEKPQDATERHQGVVLRRPLALILPVVLVAAVGGAFMAMRSTTPTACSAVAQDDHGTVSAAFTSTIGAIQKLPAVAGNSQLNGYSSDQSATVCYIDGQIPKGPPPGTSGTIPPSFDRAVVVVVGQDTIFVSAGYSQNLPIQAP